MNNSSTPSIQPRSEPAAKSLRIAGAAVLALGALPLLFGFYIPFVFFCLGVAGSLFTVAWAAPRRPLATLLIATVVLFVLTLVTFGSPFFFIPLVSSASALRSKRSSKNVHRALT